MSKSNSRDIANTRSEKVNLVLAEGNLSIEWAGFKVEDLKSYQVQLKAGSFPQSDWVTVGRVNQYANTDYYHITSLSQLEGWSCYYVRALYNSGKTSSPALSPSFRLYENKLSISQTNLNCN